MAVVVVEGYIHCRIVNYRADMRILDVMSMPSHDEGTATPATPNSCLVC